MSIEGDIFFPGETHALTDKQTWEKKTTNEQKDYNKSIRANAIKS